MRSLSEHRQARCLLLLARALGLFVVFYFYVLLRVRPELFYQQKPDVFLFDSHFFATYLDQRGGLVEYASALSFVFLRSEMYVSRFAHRLLKLSDYLLSTDY